MYTPIKVDVRTNAMHANYRAPKLVDVFIGHWINLPDNFSNLKIRCSHQMCSVRKGVLKNATCNFIKKKTLAQVFSCEFCEISKIIFFYNTSGRLLVDDVFARNG